MSRTEPTRPSRRRRALAFGVGCVLAAVLAVILFSSRGSSTSTDQVTQSAPGIPAAGASLMDLNLVPGAKALPAPPFQLVDQNGRPTSLSQFRGKAVVWSLNDDRCTDLCTLLAADVIQADHDLGGAARDVVFVSVNANPYYASPADVMAWSRANHLDGLPNWFYLTGSPAQLDTVWKAYKVTVSPDPKTRTVAHDALLQFIDPQGRSRAYGYFDKGAVSTAYYAHVMAQMADDLLPPPERAEVGGPSLPDHPGPGAAVGSQAPAFTLAPLAGGEPVSLAQIDSKPLVLNFWSSTCAVCATEMPQLQQAYGDFGGQLEMAGIDVADPGSAAGQEAARLGVRYRLLSDPDGKVASAYRVAALPVTLIVDPDGSVLARHDGPLTASQLEAVLQEDFMQLHLGGS